MEKGGDGVQEHRNYVVYKHTAPNGKVYIGITGQNPTKRWQGGHGYDGNAYFANAIKKYGWKNFKHEVILSGLSREEAINHEIELIAYYKSDKRKYGYNRNEGGSIPTEETRERVSKARKENGLNERQSMIVKSLWQDPYYRARATASRKGIKRTPEQLEHYKAGRAKQPPMSDETRRKISESNKLHTGENAVRSRRVAKVDVNTLEIIQVYVNARQAAADIGSSLNAISVVCRHNATEDMKRATKGFFWCYESDYTPELFAKYKGVQLNANGKIPRTGERASMLGTKCPESTKQVLSESNSRAVICTETGIQYRSIREAAESVGGAPDAISKCLNGRAKTSAGFHWVYADRKEAV